MPRPRKKVTRHSERRAIAPARLATGLGALAAFGALAVSVKHRRLRTLDRAVRRAAHPKGDSALTTVAYAICAAAKPHVHPFLASGLAAVAWPRTGRRALLIPAAALLSTALDRATRHVVQQRRPPRAARHPGLDRYAFPSGHTTATTAIALVTTIELDDRVAPATRRAIRAAAVVAPAILGASRIYLDEHWADDVVGGWLAGTAIACLLTSVMPET